MAALTADVPSRGLKVVLEEHDEGCYVLVFDTDDMRSPCRDDLQLDRDMAMLACEEDFGIVRGSWRVDEDWVDLL